MIEVILFLVVLPGGILAFCMSTVIWARSILPYLRMRGIARSRAPHGGIPLIPQIIDGEKAREIARAEGSCPLAFRVHGLLVVFQAICLLFWPVMKVFEMIYSIFTE